MLFRSTNKTEPYLGTLTLTIGMCTPIVMNKSHTLASYIGLSNPLILPRLNYSALKLALTPELVKQGHDFMCTKRRTYDVESLIRRIQSSHIGASVRSLLEYSKLHSSTLECHTFMR